MADKIFRLMSGLDEFKHKVEKPANSRLTFNITAEIRLKCNNCWNCFNV